MISRVGPGIMAARIAALEAELKRQEILAGNAEGERKIAQKQLTLALSQRDRAVEIAATYRIWGDPHNGSFEAADDIADRIRAMIAARPGATP